MLDIFWHQRGQISLFLLAPIISCICSKYGAYLEVGTAWVLSGRNIMWAIWPKNLGHKWQKSNLNHLIFYLAVCNRSSLYTGVLEPSFWFCCTITLLELDGHWHCFRSSTISDLMSFIFHSWLIYSFFFSPSFNQSGCWDPSHHICVLVWKKVESGKGMVCLIDCSYPSLRL